MKPILVSHPNDDMFQVLSEWICEAIPHGCPQVLHARNRSDVVDAVTRGDASTVVTYIDIAQDCNGSPIAGNGFEMVRELRAARNMVPVIVVAPCTTHELSSGIRAQPGAGLVIEGIEFEVQFKDQIRWACAQVIAREPVAGGGRRRSLPGAKGPPPIEFRIDIRLRRNGQCNYTSTSRGGKVPFRRDLMFNLDQRDVTDLIESSKRVATSAEWASEYCDVGRKLRKLIMGENIEIAVDLAFVRGLMARDNPDSLPTVRFIVEKDVHFIALEALLDERDGYWLERAPVCRQLDFPGLNFSRIPLFQDPQTRKGPINCLIVDANASANVVAAKHTFSPLSGVTEEANWLANYLRNHKNARMGKIGRVWRNSADGAMRRCLESTSRPPSDERCSGTFAQVLEETLTKEGPWHIVHFAGHAHYDAANDYGWLVLPGNTSAGANGDLRAEVVGTPVLSGWLADTSFVYMSSCHGSSGDFVFHFCKSGVPAVSGFHFDVNDSAATEHARLFYEGLFERRSLEDAFARAWKWMYSHYRKEDRVWTSSELIVQLAGRA